MPIPIEPEQESRRFELENARFMDEISIVNRTVTPEEAERQAIEHGKRVRPWAWVGTGQYLLFTDGQWLNQAGKFEISPTQYVPKRPETRIRWSRWEVL